MIASIVKWMFFITAILMSFATFGEGLSEAETKVGLIVAFCLYSVAGVIDAIQGED